MNEECNTKCKYPVGWRWTRLINVESESAGKPQYTTFFEPKWTLAAQATVPRFLHTIKRIDTHFNKIRVVSWFWLHDNYERRSSATKSPSRSKLERGSFKLVKCVDKNFVFKRIIRQGRNMERLEKNNMPQKLTRPIRRITKNFRSLEYSPISKPTTS